MCQLRRIMKSPRPRISKSDNDNTFYVTAEGGTTLDLNGHKLTTSAEKSYGTIGVKENAHLVIKDSKGSGVVDCPNNIRGLFYLTNNASLTIFGDTFKAHEPLIYNSYTGNYTIKVLGGNIDAQRLYSNDNKLGNYYLRGGCYSPTLYRSISSYTDKIENGYLFKEESGDYPWRIVSGVKATHGEETTTVEKDENDRFVIDLTNLTKLEVAQDFNNVNVTVQKDFTTANE